MNQRSRHALVVPIYGDMDHCCLERLIHYAESGFKLVVVNNNQNCLSELDGQAFFVVHHQNIGGLAGGLNAGVNALLESEVDVITFLDQDSIISVKSLDRLAESACLSRIVGPRVIDSLRGCEHTSSSSFVRILITSGTTFLLKTWTRVGGLLSWMEIDYIDHEWSCRARSVGLNLVVHNEATLNQTFGVRHPSPLGHLLGMQYYSPYRRSIALRNLRWLIRQEYVPLDIRIKEVAKMLLKPWVILMTEPGRQKYIQAMWVGMTAPLGKPFPRKRLGFHQ